jgi:imidazolonepropionase-like amidohydrolase
MHVHLRRRDQLPLYVANGVTLVRDMWGGPDTLAMREAIAEGTLFGPEIVAGSPGLDGSPPTFPDGPSAETPDEIRALVREQAEAGFDFIKTYDRLRPALFAALADEAAAVGLPFAGHVPFAVPIDQALASGMASIEHLQGYWFAYAEGSVGLPDGPVAPEQAVPRLMQALSRAEAEGGSAADLFDADDRAALARETAESGVWNTPTLIASIATNTPSDEHAAAFARPEMAYVHPDQLAQWRPENNFRFQFLDDAQIRALRRLAAENFRLVEALNDAGAGLLAGTDAPEAFVVPGFSIHRELGHLVEAGLTPAEALRTATTNPAEFLGLADEWGCVAEGCAADLVVLAANPLDDIAATREIEGVVRDGDWLPRAELDRRLEAVRAGFAE